MTTMRSLLLTVAVAISGVAYAESPLTATLTLAPATVLPGLPAAFLVTITNSSGQMQQIFDTARLTDTVDGASYDATEVNLPAEQMEKCGDSRCLNIPPHGTKEVYFDFGPSLAGNPFFVDSRLASVGAHNLKITLLTSGSDNSEVELTTQTATLTVQQPQGVDADAWNWLAQEMGGSSPGLSWARQGSTLAAQLRAQFPTSRYATWTAALSGATKDEQLANISAALATNPPVGLRDALLFASGSLSAQWNRVAIYSLRDLQLALKYADAATTTLGTLRDNGVSSYVRQRAAALITELYTTKTGSATLRDLAAADPPAPLPIVPRVECVSRGSGQTFSARFGYVNPNHGQKVIALGDANQITPAPRDQGQPRVFKPGGHAGVFTASSPGGQLKWHLDGNDAVATAEFAVQCSSP